MTKVQEAISRFDAVSDKHRALGATDTEPRAEFTLMLERLYEGKDAEVPSGVSYPGWGLFSDMDGAQEAADEMTAAAQAVVDAAAASKGYELSQAMHRRYGRY